MRRGIGRLRAGGGGSAVMPAGALGIWYADQYDSATKSIPNSVAVSAPTTNYIRFPRRMFASATAGGIDTSGLTVTDSAATAWDGSNDASTMVAVGDWFFGPAAGLPNGTYTMGVTLRSGNGITQQIQMGNITGTGGAGTSGGLSATQAVTTTRARYSNTFTVSNSNGWPLVISFDRATGVNLEVSDFDIWPGTSDLGPTSPVGHLYYGPKRWSGTSPTTTGGIADLSTAVNMGGCIQLPAVSLTNFTALAVVNKTALGRTNFNSILSTAKNGGLFGFFTDINQTQAGAYFNGSQQFTQDASGSTFWNLVGKGWHLLALRYDGTNLSLWIDDSCVLTKAVSLSAQVASDLFVGAVTSYTGTPSSVQLNSLALYASALTAAQIATTAYSVLSRKAIANGLSITKQARILLAEGDSISAVFTSYPWLYTANASPAILGGVYAVSASVVGTSGDAIGTNSLYGRKSYLLAAMPPGGTTGRKFIVSVFIGANDLATTDSAATFLTNLAAYLDLLRAAGATVALGTVLPRSDAQAVSNSFLTKRATVNPELRLWTTSGSIVTGKHADYIFDFAAEATMGPDGASDNLTYYNADKVHPIAAGQTLLEAVYRASINAIPA